MQMHHVVVCIIASHVTLCIIACRVIMCITSSCALQNAMAPSALLCEPLHALAFQITLYRKYSFGFDLT